MHRSTILLCAVALMLPGCGSQGGGATPPVDTAQAQRSAAEAEELVNGTNPVSACIGSCNARANSYRAQCEARGGSHKDCVDQAQDVANECKQNCTP